MPSVSYANVPLSETIEFDPRLAVQEAIDAILQALQSEAPSPLIVAKIQPYGQVGKSLWFTVHGTTEFVTTILSVVEGNHPGIFDRSKIVEVEEIIKSQFRFDA